MSVELVNKARENPIVETLYKRVNASSPISLTSNSGQNWSSSTEFGRTTIGVAPTKLHEEALYHELLHAELKNAGYNQNWVCFVGEAKSKAVHPLLIALNNELQHHRMFESFLAAGFASSNFYCDADVRTYSKVRRELGRTKAKAPSIEFLRMFLPIIAPGGAGSEEDRQKLRVFFQSRCPEPIFAKLLSIESLIKNWAAGSSLDPLPVVAEIIRELGVYDKIWIGYSSSDFSAKGGHLIGSEFTMADAV